MNFDNNERNKKNLSEVNEIIGILKLRFEKNLLRHLNISWSEVETRLISPIGREKIGSLIEMEKTGGEPDVIGKNEITNGIIFCDCSKESPKGRRSLCYDREALVARKEFKPTNNVMDMATEMGVQILTENQYRALQALEEFDTKTSSWVQTPTEIRELGGAIFCDRRYNQVFVYHNGAESYYSSRGFRSMLEI